MAKLRSVRVAMAPHSIQSQKSPSPRNPPPARSPCGAHPAPGPPLPRLPPCASPPGGSAGGLGVAALVLPPASWPGAPTRGRSQGPSYLGKHPADQHFRPPVGPASPPSSKRRPADLPPARAPLSASAPAALGLGPAPFRHTRLPLRFLPI